MNKRGLVVFALLSGPSLSAHHDGKPSCLGIEDALSEVSWITSRWWARSPMVDHRIKIFRNIKDGASRFDGLNLARREAPFMNGSAPNAD